MKPKTIVAFYLLIQAASIAVWWCVLFCRPSSIEWFHPKGWSAEGFYAFWLPDLLLLAGGSGVASFAAFHERRWATSAVGAVAAACWYPALYCVAVSVQTDEAWVASAMMVSMAGMALAMATIYGNATQSPATVRVTAMSKTSALRWTVAQTVVFWCVFLWILPQGIVEIERAQGVLPFTVPGQQLGSGLLFCLASALGLWSGVAMANYGDGTPLPTATAPRLVIAGPYRFVRNPMALAGIVQGIAVGWYLGSVSVVVYALTGAMLWHTAVRPYEEQDLMDRFGETYQSYRRQVGLWVPRISRK